MTSFGRLSSYTMLDAMKSLEVNLCDSQLQVAHAPSSDDDDMPLAMLPISLSAAKHPATAPNKTPSSLDSPPSLKASADPAASNTIATETAGTRAISTETEDREASDTRPNDKEAVNTVAIDTGAIHDRAIDTEAVSAGTTDTERLDNAAVHNRAVMQPSAAEGALSMASAIQRPDSRSEPASAGEGHHLSSVPEHANLLNRDAVTASWQLPNAAMDPKDANPHFKSVSDVLRPMHGRQFTPPAADAASLDMHQQANSTEKQDPAHRSGTVLTEQPPHVDGTDQQPAARQAEELISDSESEGGQGAIAPAVSSAAMANSVPGIVSALQLPISSTDIADNTAAVAAAANAAEHADHSTAAAAGRKSLSTAIHPATAAAKAESLSTSMHQDNPPLVQGTGAEMSHGIRQTSPVLPMRRQMPTSSSGMTEAVVPAILQPAPSTEQQGLAQLPATEASLHRQSDSPTAVSGRAASQLYDSSVSLQQAEAEAARLALLMRPTQSWQTQAVHNDDSVPAVSLAPPVGNDDNAPAAPPAQPVSNDDKVPASSLAQPGLMPAQPQSAPLASPSPSAAAEAAVDSVGTEQHKQQPSGRPRLALRNRNGGLQQLAMQVANRQHGTASGLQPSAVTSSSEQHANAGKADGANDITIPDR